MKAFIKKNILWLLVVLCIISTAATVTVAKYVSSLDSEGGMIEAPGFYFRSNVMKETASVDTTETVHINGKTTEIILANGIDSEKYSNVNIAYTLSYKVKNGSEWVEAKRTEEVFLKDSLVKNTLEITPITYSGTEYKTVLIEAVATSPYSKTLRTIIEFDYSGYTKSYSYSSGVITLALSTNFDSGSFTLGWVDGITPDNSDPNLILTDVTASQRSVNATLSESTVYVLKFFVTDSALLSDIENGVKTPESVVSVTR